MLFESITDNVNLVKPETVTGTGEILEDISATGRRRPWSERKMQNRQLVELFEQALKIDETILSESRLVALKDCASWLMFAEDEDFKRKLKAANFCRIRVCPMCNWRRSLKLFSQVSEITDAILFDKRARFIFVTLTIRNVSGDSLVDAINRMNTGFSGVFQNRLNLVDRLTEAKLSQMPFK